MSKILDTRPSPIAGQWYEGEPRRLAVQVDRYVSEAHLPELNGQVIAVMAPHAGLLYSGPVAGYAFGALRGLTPDVVVVVSPMHYPYFEPLLTSAHVSYETPLGKIPVDRRALETLHHSLLERLGFGLTPVANDPEHSLEIELPFLQRVLEKPFSLVPVMVREQSSRVARILGAAIASLVSVDLAAQKRSAVLVASTDLSHFYPESTADVLDAFMLQQVEAFDPDGVIQADEQGKGFACGRGALAAVLWAAKDLGADAAQVLHHQTSAAVTGDYERVVGYAAAAITRRN